MSETNKKTSSGLEQNVAGLLCYLLGFITGIIFLVIENDNKFVRFHAYQSTITFGSIFVINIILTFIPILGWILTVLIAPLTFILWIVLMIKAYQGQYFKLPIVGDIAKNQMRK